MNFRKVKLVVLILFCVVFYSCERYDAIIHYQYNGVTITRLDKDAVSYFYYGFSTKESDLPEDYIEASYHGFDGVMDGYLIFSQDKKVILVPATYFKEKGIAASFSLKQYDNPNFIKWRDSIHGNYGNIIQVSNIIKLEKEYNIKNYSKVKALY